MGRCELLRLNGHSDVCFLDGTQVPKKTKVQYLGAVLTANGDCSHDVTATGASNQPSALGQA